MNDNHAKKTGEVLSPVPATSTTPTQSPTTTTPAPTPAKTSTPHPTPVSNPRQLIEDEFEKAAAQEEQELYDTLQQITQEFINQETESKRRAYIKEKLIRYQIIMIRKNHIIKSTQEKVKSLEFSLQHNSALSEEVVEQQKKELEVASNKSKKLKTELKKLKMIIK